jgi:hypothetical protein
MAVEMRQVERLPGGAAAARVFRRTKREWGYLVVDSVLAETRTKGTYSSLSDSAILLTKEEAAQLAEEIDDVVRRWSDRTRVGDGDRITYLHYAVLTPYPEQADRTGDIHGP